MKKCLLMLLITALLLPLLAQAEAPVSATERILFYHQGCTDELLEKYTYNAVPCKSASFTVLGGNGCSIFAGLHAYQWLYGKFADMEEQTLHARQMVRLLNGESPAVKGNGPYVAYHYAYEQGAYKVISLKKTAESLRTFFNEKGGAVYLHASWPGGGHYFIAVGYTLQEIDGKMTFLLHIVDSGGADTVTRFTAYDFETFQRAVADPSWEPAQEYWMPLQNGVDIAYGLWTK